MYMRRFKQRRRVTPRRRQCRAIFSTFRLSLEAVSLHCNGLLQAMMAVGGKLLITKQRLSHLLASGFLCQSGLILGQPALPKVYSMFQFLLAIRRERWKCEPLIMSATAAAPV